MAFPLRNIARTAALAGGLWLGASSAAMAQNWIGPVVASYDDVEHDCRLEVSGNGRFYRLTATGLEPGEPAQFLLYNEDIVPIDRTVRAGQNGVWAEFYMPALAHRHLGTVDVFVTGSRCNLEASFDWRRPSAFKDRRPAWTASHYPEE